LQILNSAAEVPRVSFSIYLLVFLLTCLLESPFYFFLLKSYKPFYRQPLLALFIANLSTHPMVCFGIPALVAHYGGSYGVSNSIGEVFAPTLEALLLWRVWKVPAAQAIAGAIVANVFSWWVGVYLVSFVSIF
jgi:hypothetical protein